MRLNRTQTNLPKFVLLFILLTSCSQVISIPTDQSSASKERIIFASDRDGIQNFYIMNSDGGDLQTLNMGEFPKGATVTQIIWSPRIDRYFFTAATNSDSEIYSIKSGETRATNLTNTPEVYEADIVLSPNDKHIAYVGTEYESDIYVMNTDGSQRKNLTNWATRQGNIAWSPDSLRIFFSSLRAGTPNIFSININGTELINISQGSGLDGYFSLSPDGKQLTFDSDRAGYMDIFVVNSSGGDALNITKSSEIRDVEPLWSSIGNYIAFRSDIQGGSDIYIISLDDNSVINLTNTPDISESSISWSNNSQSLFFVAETGGQLDIYKVGLDGTPPTNISNHPGNDHSPTLVKSK